MNDKDAIVLRYSDNFKNIFDLYLNNSCTDPKMVGAKTVEDSMAEFALGKVAWCRTATGDGARWLALKATL